MVKELSLWIAFRFNVSTIQRFNADAPRASQSLHSPFTRANAHRLFHFGYEHLSVADFSSLGGSQNGFDGPLRAVVSNNHFEFDFGEEIDCVLGAAINFAMPFLASKSLYLTDRHSFHACRH
jgi:hypothetical protein